MLLSSLLMDIKSTGVGISTTGGARRRAVVWKLRGFVKIIFEACAPLNILTLNDLEIVAQFIITNKISKDSLSMDCGTRLELCAVVTSLTRFRLHRTDYSNDWRRCLYNEEIWRSLNVTARCERF